VLTAKRIGKPSMAAIADAVRDRAQWELGAVKQLRRDVQPRGAKLFAEGELACSAKTRWSPRPEAPIRRATSDSRRSAANSRLMMASASS
jgi:hypothetical protein